MILIFHPIAFGFRTLATNSANDETYIHFLTRLPGTHLYYRVKAINGSVESSPSNPITVKAPSFDGASDGTVEAYTGAVKTTSSTTTTTPTPSTTTPDTTDDGGGGGSLGIWFTALLGLYIFLCRISPRRHILGNKRCL